MIINHQYKIHNHDRLSCKSITDFNDIKVEWLHIELLTNKIAIITDVTCDIFNRIREFYNNAAPHHIVTDLRHIIIIEPDAKTFFLSLFFQIQTCILINTAAPTYI